jgi:predicted kinase
MNINELKQPYVIILIGPPLSGKSTWIKNNFQSVDVEVISRDEIVKEVFGEDDYDKAFSLVDQKEVDKLLVSKISESANNHRNVIIDMTHMTSKRRKFNLSFFGQEYYKLAVIFPILKEEEYIKRNSKRSEEESKTIPLKVIKSMISSYQPVSKSEGFDKIISI